MTLAGPAESTFDHAEAARWVAARWRDDIVDQLRHYITIPALSPAFDPEWAATGHLAAAVDHVAGWMRDRPLAGMTVEVQHLPGRTPVIVADVPAFGPGADDGTTVLLYGHLDKQPEMEGWRPGLGPWIPVIEGDRLYGRGGADDGYSAYASLTALEAIQAHGGRHRRCVVVIEASEESGSPDLPAHVEALAARLGDVRLVLCLDSGTADYETVWLTTSLRGLVDGVLTVGVLSEGVHSGAASGIVPSSFRIIRQLLDRVEDAATGRVLLPEANVEIPPYRVEEARAVVEATGAHHSYPFLAGVQPMTADPLEAVLARTWRPALSYIGIDGVPPVERAGNVLRPSTSLKLSLRIPPTGDPDAIRAALKATLEADPPYGATVSFERPGAAPGWNAPDLAPWLRTALDTASGDAFGRPAQLTGEGGTIPFMGMLGERFPRAQFVVTGVLGPESNAHGPNEFLHLPYAERLTLVMARLLDAAAA